MSDTTEGKSTGGIPVATTYTKSYVYGEFGDTSKPLDYITLKAGDRELAILPLREIAHMATELREEIEMHHMENQIPPTPLTDREWPSLRNHPDETAVSVTLGTLRRLERQLAKAIEQRDALAEALEEMRYSHTSSDTMPASQRAYG